MTDTTTMTWPGIPGGAAPPGLPRLLPGRFLAAGDGPPSPALARHVQVHGPLPDYGPGPRLIEEIRSAGLTGRGGAAFPVAVKMTAVAQRRRPVVVGNGAEGEPASGKDRCLLRWSPHLVLDGLQCAAQAVGARHAYLYVHPDGQLHRLLADALAERSAARRDRVAVELVAAPPRFLAGEESALANRVAGGLALPTFKVPRVFERGVGGAPTLVQNVETLGHVALIAQHGAAWFRSAGTQAEPGSMLVTCHPAGRRAGVREVEIGTPIAEVLGLDEPGGLSVEAVLTGGYHGTWLPAAQAAALPLANSALRQAGAALGAGVLAALPAGRCGLVETARVVRYLAAESAGQCGPCLNGLPRIADALTQLSRPGPDRRCLADLQRWTSQLPGRGACQHPDGTVRLVRSALGVFSGEVQRHMRGTCSAGRGDTRPPVLPVPAHGPADRRDWR